MIIHTQLKYLQLPSELSPAISGDFLVDHKFQVARFNGVKIT